VVDVSDFNPIFAQKLAAYRDALTKAGVNTSINSGYRSPEYQQQLIDQGVRPAAKPWGSFHQYGLAADLTTDPANYQRMWDTASQYGLHALGAYDPGHVQLAGALPDLISQYHLANWRPESQPAPASGAIAYAGPSGQPSRVATTAPGTSINSSPLDIVLNAESGDRNINNIHQTTSSGQAQGNVQITTGTWSDFAPKAGVDLQKYPTPDSAPRAVQIAVASQIPLKRWASSTVNAVLAKYPGIDTSQTLGAIQSAAINSSGAPTAVAGGPPAVAGAGQPAQAPAGLAGGLPGFTPNSPGAKMTAQGLQQLAGGGGGGEPSPLRLQQAQPAQAMGGPMMMQPGGQNMQGRMAAQQALAQQGFSMQPQLASAYGALGAARPPVPAMAPGQATGIPGIAGTTLNSPSQLQMALMTGAMSPYDLYAGIGGGFGST
jgi:D-alanyl-D-alanine carboxypeptidase-like protein